MELNRLIEQALEVKVAKDGNLTLPVDKIEVRNYDKVTYAGRTRLVDWVTEYNYVSKQSLSVEEYEKLLEENGHQPTGEISFKKKRLTYGNGEIYYRHICYAVMY